MIRRRSLKAAARLGASTRTWLWVFVTRFFIARRGLAAAIRNLLHVGHGRLLYVGCGRQTVLAALPVYQYSDWTRFQRTETSAVADITTTANRFLRGTLLRPLLCTQVLEHVFNPNEFVAEMHRVLSPGTARSTVPFVCDEHETFDLCLGIRALDSSALRGERLAMN